MFQQPEIFPLCTVMGEYLVRDQQVQMLPEKNIKGNVLVGVGRKCASLNDDSPKNSGRLNNWDFKVDND